MSGRTWKSYQQCNDTDSCSSSDSNDETVPKRKRPCALPKKSRIKKSWNRLMCSLECVSPRLVAMAVLYTVSTLLLLAFLFSYGPTLVGHIIRLGKIIMHAVLPASWLKSTNDIIQEALAKYSADRLGVADYALGSAGGSVLCSSETFFAKSGALYSIFGIPIWYHSSNPREVIQPEMQPGKCWAMNGSNGYVMIQLAMPVVITAISMEHIPEEVAPSGQLDSAPKQFAIVGKEKDMNSPDVMLGAFVYHIDQKRPIQLYEIKDPYCTRQALDSSTCGPNNQVFSIVNLKILSNHGNPDYTCIYRLRVHGRPLTAHLQHQDL